MSHTTDEARTTFHHHVEGYGQIAHVGFYNGNVVGPKIYKYWVWDDIVIQSGDHCEVLVPDRTADGGQRVERVFVNKVEKYDASMHGNDFKAKRVKKVATESPDVSYRVSDAMKAIRRQLTSFQQYKVYSKYMCELTGAERIELHRWYEANIARPNSVKEAGIKIHEEVQRMLESEHPHLYNDDKIDALPKHIFNLIQDHSKENTMTIINIESRIFITAPGLNNAQASLVTDDQLISAINAANNEIKSMKAYAENGNNSEKLLKRIHALEDGVKELVKLLDARPAQ